MRLQRESSYHGVMTVAIVVILLLVGLGLVSSQLFRLRDWLKKAPPPLPSDHPDHPSDAQGT